jgi:uncharacterized membrane protein YebE (DUF533 family)
MPLIFYGTYPITSRGQEGTFHCPRCGESRPYLLKNWTRFFHLYWIPLIPYSWGSFVECGDCRATWEEKVLDYDPEAAQAEFRAGLEEAMLRAMIAMAEADGHVGEDEIRAIAGIMTRLSGREHQPGQVRATLASVGCQSIQSALRGVSDSLNDNGKEMVISSLFWVANAEGGVSAEEHARILEAGKALSLKRESVEQILEDLSANP